MIGTIENNDRDTTNMIYGEEEVQANYGNYFKDKIGKYFTYSTDNSWLMKDGRSRIVELESIHKHFINVYIMNPKGQRLYRESINLKSLFTKEDKLEMITYA